MFRQDDDPGLTDRHQLHDADAVHPAGAAEAPGGHGRTHHADDGRPVGRQEHLQRRQEGWHRCPVSLSPMSVSCSRLLSRDSRSYQYCLNAV